MIYGLKTFSGGRVVEGSSASPRQEEGQSADNERSSSNDTRQPDRVHDGPSCPAAGCNEDERYFLNPVTEDSSRFLVAGSGAGAVLPKTDSEIAGARVASPGIRPILAPTRTTAGRSCRAA